MFEFLYKSRKKVKWTSATFFGKFRNLNTLPIHIGWLSFGLHKRKVGQQLLEISGNPELKKFFLSAKKVEMVDC